MRETGFVWHESYMWHDTGNAALFAPPGEWVQPDSHVESPETKRRLRNLLEVSGLLDELTRVEPREASRDELLGFHREEYVDKVEELSTSGGGEAGVLTPVDVGSYRIARLAAGGAMKAVDAVAEGRVDNAYALVRPPGHHAEEGMGKGFCVFNNVVLAVERALESFDRVAVVDVDVHHGNGTENAFLGRDDVLTVSLHQDSFYPPSSGGVDEVGDGDGEGFNLNVPLPPGSGEGAYLEAFERVVVPALDGFEPEFLFVAAGYDASAFDPMGRMMLHSDCYREMTAELLDAAERHCDGRIVAVHEGGYSPAYVPFAGHAVVEELSDADPDARDPFLPVIRQMGYQELQRHQEEAVDDAASNLGLSLR